MAYTKPRSAKDQRTRNWLIAGGLFIFFLGSYGSGMEAEIHQAKAVNERRKVAEQNYRDAQRKLILRITAVEQLEARRQVALALADIDARNFGDAQNAVNRAAALLDQAEAAATSNPDLSEEAAALQKTSLVAGTDSGAQVTALRALARQMDQAFDTFTPTFISASTHDDVTHPIKPPTMNDVPELPGTDKGADLVNGQDYKK